MRIPSWKLKYLAIFVLTSEPHGKVEKEDAPTRRLKSPSMRISSWILRYLAIFWLSNEPLMGLISIPWLQPRDGYLEYLVVF